MVDVRGIQRQYPSRKIYMGYGDGNTYAYTFSRVELVFSGEPYFLDSAALMDFDFSGIAIPDATIEKLVSEEDALWLIPINAEPFTIKNWYWRHDEDGYLFDEPFRAAFNSGFEKLATSTYFDIWQPVSPTK